MNGRIYYIGLYSGDAGRLKRKNLRTNPAGTAKMDYILYALKAIGRQVVLLSVAGSKNTGFCRQEQFRVDNQEEHVYIPSLVIRIFGKNIVRGDLIRFFLKRYIVQHIGQDDTVIVYHSLIYKDLIARLHKKIGFRLILEVEEIYQDVVSCSAHEKAMEWRVLRSADAYIFSTKNLGDRLNKNQLPSVVVNGNYRVQKNWGESFPDAKCHCVYSGTFDPTKGAASAAAAAGFLDENYHIHILGFGTEQEKELLLKQIEAIRQKTSCTLSYDGMMIGEEFIRFLQKCHIGLCTQDLDANYTNTSFPSKISTYLANGLRVVSGRIPALEQSDLGSCIFYCEKISPKEIADAIQKIDLAAPYDSRSVLMQLDHSFQQQLNLMLG